MTTSIIIVLIAIVNAFVQINASAENAYASSKLRTQTDPYMNNNDRQRHHQINNFANGNNKHNVINVDQTSNGFSVSSYEADRNIRPTSTDYNVILNNPDTSTIISNVCKGVENRNPVSFNNNRQKTRRTQTWFYPNNLLYGGYFHRPLKEVQNNANIGTSSNDNKLFIEGRRLNIYPNQPDNHGRDSGVQTASPVVGNTQYRYNSGNFEDNKARTLTNRMGGGTYNTQNSGQNGNNANNYHARSGVQNVPDDTISSLYDSTRFVDNYGRGENNRNIIKIETS